MVEQQIYLKDAENKELYGVLHCTTDLEFSDLALVIEKIKKDWYEESSDDYLTDYIIQKLNEMGFRSYIDREIELNEIYL